MVRTTRLDRWVTTQPVGTGSKGIPLSASVDGGKEEEQKQGQEEEKQQPVLEEGKGLEEEGGQGRIARRGSHPAYRRV